MSVEFERVLERRGDGVVVTVWVVSGAKDPRIVGVHGGALRVRVAAAREAGKANRAVEALLARAFGTRRVALIGGVTSRRKRFAVDRIDVADAAARLADASASATEC